MPTLFLWAVIILLILIWAAIIGLIMAVNNHTIWFAQIEAAIEKLSSR